MSREAGPLDVEDVLAVAGVAAEVADSAERLRPRLER
jgi:hypothetical protein